MRIVNIFLLSLSVFLLSFGVAQAETECFKCHDQAEFSGKVIHGPLKKGKCTTCHNPHLSRYDSLLNDQVVDLCLSCHEQDENDDFAHKPVRDGECLICHDPHAADSKGLLREKKRGGTCFTCHNDLPKKYKVRHAPYAKGQCVSCHLAHGAERIQLLKLEPDLLCRSCHKQDLSSSHKGFPGKLSSCLSCHNPHGSNRPSLIREVSHPPFEEGCDSCHEGGGKVGTDKCFECHEEMKEQVQSLHNHLTSKKDNSCVNCHSPHAADGEKMLRNKQWQLCRPCHADTFRNYRDSPYSHPETGSCSDCHALHGSDNLAMLRGDGNEVCTRCHETQGQFTHPVGEAVIDPRNGMMVSCVSCHYPHGTDFKLNLKRGGEKDLCVPCHKNY